MISLVLYIAVAAVLVCSALRSLSDNIRAVMCWTFSAVGFVASGIVYASQSGGFSPSGGELITALVGAALVAAVGFAVELLAPSKRLRNKQNQEYDSAVAENALNIVLVIVTSACCAAAILCDSFGRTEFVFLSVIPAAAVSLRQLSYYLYRVRLVSLSTDIPEERRKKLIKSLSGGRSRL